MTGRPGRVVVFVAVALLAPLPVQGLAFEDAVRFLVGFDAWPPHLAEGDDLHGATVAALYPALGVAAVVAPFSDAFLVRASTDERIEYVEEPRAVHLQGIVDRQWALGQIGIDVNAPPPASQGRASVCIVDTGVAALDETKVLARPRAAWNFVDGNADVRDENGHGTHVASVVTATGADGGLRGVGTAIPYYVAKVFGKSTNATTEHVAAAIVWCADQRLTSGRPVVVSMSLGFGHAPDATVARAVDLAHASGALLVAAAGNDGCVGCIQYPAAFPKVVAVTCTARFERFCHFSSAGAEAEIAAPGAGVLGLAPVDGSYRAMSGTSVSAPHVAAAAALAWSKARGPSVGLEPSNEEIRKLLQKSAEPLTGPGRDPKFGHGELDVACLLDMVDGRSCTRAIEATDCAFPDAFGYRCDSEPASGLTAIGGESRESVEVTLPFEVFFYGLKFARVTVHPGGFVTFDAACGLACPTPAAPPSRLPPNNVALVADGADAFRRTNRARDGLPVFVVEWTKGGALHGRLVLESHTNDLVVEGDTDRIVGIEDASGNNGLATTCCASGRAVRFAHPGALVPGAPSGLVAKQRAGQTHWIDVSWTPPPSDDPARVRYEVWRGTEAAVAKAVLVASNVTATSVPDDLRTARGPLDPLGAPRVLAGTADTFYYFVRGVNAAGRGPFAQTCARGTPPDAATAALPGCFDLVPLERGGIR